MAEENGEDPQELIHRRLSVDSKPLWAHGIDVLGYWLSSFRHAILPLENVIDNNKKSPIIVADFGESGTSKILQVIQWPTLFFCFRYRLLVCSSNKTIRFNYRLFYFMNLE